MIEEKEYLSGLSWDKNINIYKTSVVGSKRFYYKKRVICIPIFYPHSYGFRQKKSAHQALKNIKH
jgi:retron-type reverse transcriptase